MFTPDNIQDVEDKAQGFLQELDRALGEHNSPGQPWVFGEQPTIVDAHATAMILRLMDVNRREMLPERVQAYARAVSATEEWNEVAHGRTTLWNVSLGHVADLDPL